MSLDKMTPNPAAPGTMSSADILRTLSRYEMKRSMKKRVAPFLNDLPTSAGVSNHERESERSRILADRRLTLLHAASALASLPLTNPHRRTGAAVEGEPVRNSAEFALSLISTPTTVRKTPKTFPEVLMDVLSCPDAVGMIEWLPDGKAFVITEPFDLASEILPRYFKQSQFESFIRKLNRWGFRRFQAKSQDSGAFFHELFIRDRPELCKKMGCKSINDATKKQQLQAIRSRGIAAPARKIQQASKQQQQQRSSVLEVDAAPENATIRVPSPRLETSTVADSINPFKIRHAAHADIASSLSSMMSPTSLEGLYQGASLTRPYCGSIRRMHGHAAALSNLLAKRSTAITTARGIRAPVPSSTKSSMPGTATADSTVAASFLRHQKLLRKTQHSRAMLRQSGLLTGPPSL